MKLSKKKFPFLFKKDVGWFFAKDYEGKEHPFSFEALDEALHDKSLVRDYYSIAILEKHWDMFDEVYLSGLLWLIGGRRNWDQQPAPDSFCKPDMLSEFY